MAEKPHKNLTNGAIMFRRHWKGNIDGEIHHTVIWATDDALALLRYNGPTFIDMMFKTVPRPFSQCLIKIKKNIASRTGYISGAQINRNTHVGS
ncbi:hypothetical protein HZS_7082 [Henneguya salminicola]|nr:hypothetical protein HZS_7082 [Henneguya salminicola]